MGGPYSPPCEERAFAARPQAQAPCPPRRRPFVLAAAILGSSMVFIDGSSLSVALPALRDGLSASPAELNWIVNAYVLALAALTLIGGAASDRFGRRAVFVAGAAGFALASIACGLARSAELLIAFRALQGVFGAMLAPASLALIAAAYPRAERARAIGLWAGASALTTAGGPVVGGFLVDALHWSAIFFINAPVALAAVALARVSPETRARDRARPFDLPGAALCAAGLGLMAYGLVGLGEEAALRPALTALAAGGLVLVAFAVWEQVTAEPMAPPSLFRIAPLAGANLFTLCAYAGLGGALFVLPLMLADERGWSASAIGAAFLPFTLAVGLLSRFTGGLAGRLGAGRVIAGGAGLAALGFLMLGLAPATWPAAVSVFLPMGVIGLGFAGFIPALTDIAVSSAPEALEGVASGVNNAAARIAQMVGTAGAAAFLAAGAGEASFPAAAVLCGLGGAAAAATLARRQPREAR